MHEHSCKQKSSKIFSMQMRLGCGGLTGLSVTVTCVGGGRNSHPFPDDEVQNCIQRKLQTQKQRSPKKRWAKNARKRKKDPYKRSNAGKLLSVLHLDSPGPVKTIFSPKRLEHFKAVFLSHLILDIFSISAYDIHKVFKVQGAWATAWKKV